MTRRTYRGIRSAALVLNALATVVPIYIWLGLVQVRPLSDLLRTPAILVAVVSLAPVLALIALLVTPERRKVSL